MKILIVEDETYSRQSLVKQIVDMDAEKKFEILQASNGRLGWQLFERELPDLVLSDIKMPLIDGLELLRRMMRRQPETKVVMVSGYADFEFARQAVNDGAIGYLLKPVAEDDLKKIMQKVLDLESNQKSRPKIQEVDDLTHYIYRNIMHEQNSGDYIHDSIFKKIFQGYSLVGILFIGDAYPTRDRIAADIQAVKTGETRFEYRLLNFAQDLWCLVIPAPLDIGEIVRRLDHHLLAAGYRFVLGVSEPTDSLGKIRASWQHALWAIKSKIFEAKRVFYYTDVVRSRASAYKLADSQMDMIRICLEHGDEQGAWSNIQKIMQGLTKTEQLSIGSLEHFLLKLNLVCREALDHSGLDPEAIQAMNLELNLLSYDSLDDLLRAIQDLVRLVEDKITGQRKQGQEFSVDNVLKYIQTHYNTDMSLKDLADKVFFLNHTYLSHLIAEKTGQTYTSYLRRIRIEKAREFLQNANLSITEVANLSGYNDVSLFIQVFKKEVGLTPNKYKQIAVNPIGRE